MLITIMEVVEDVNEEYDIAYEVSLKDIIDNLLLIPHMINKNYIIEQLSKYNG
jgi:hypothetical protein